MKTALLAMLLAVPMIGACPTEHQVLTLEWFAADRGCAVPIEDARIYTRKAHEEIAQEIAGLERMVLERDKRLDACRNLLQSSRLSAAATIRSAADEVRALAERMEATADPPSRLNWFGGGALLGGACAAILTAMILI